MKKKGSQKRAATESSDESDESDHRQWKKKHTKKDSDSSDDSDKVVQVIEPEVETEIVNDEGGGDSPDDSKVSFQLICFTGC